MGFEDQIESLATLGRSPATAVVLGGAFWEFGIAEVIRWTLLLLGVFVVTALLVEYKDELATTCAILFAAICIVAKSTRNALGILVSAVR